MSGVLHELDGTAITSKEAFFDAVAAALSFPDWFGRNLDALYDCLRDLSWLPAGEQELVWTASEVLREADPRAYTRIVDVLRDAAEPGRLSVLIR